ncbi:MAG: hypothetical protein JW753_11655 [Dehalococcoidia bacterium]|nr:hypothetical protein [Dehalococcoidia bacterium]
MAKPSKPRVSPIKPAARRVIIREYAPVKPERRARSFLLDYIGNILC